MIRQVHCFYARLYERLSTRYEYVLQLFTMTKETNDELDAILNSTTTFLIENVETVRSICFLILLL